MSIFWEWDSNPTKRISLKDSLPFINASLNQNAHLYIVFAGIAQLVEHDPSKFAVESSNLFARSNYSVGS